MALFSRKQTTEDQKTDAKAESSSVQKVAASSTDRDLASVLKKPRLSEKAVGKSEQNVYTFLVRKDATKYDVRDAVKQLYSVTPVKVNIVNKASREILSRRTGRRTTEKGMKKAYVYLKSGDSINFV